MSRLKYHLFICGRNYACANKRSRVFTYVGTVDLRKYILLYLSVANKRQLASLSLAVALNDVGVCFPETYMEVGMYGRLHQNTVFTSAIFQIFRKTRYSCPTSIATMWRCFSKKFDYLHGTFMILLTRRLNVVGFGVEVIAIL